MTFKQCRSEYIWVIKDYIYGYMTPDEQYCVYECTGIYAPGEDGSRICSCRTHVAPDGKTCLESCDNYDSKKSMSNSDVLQCVCSNFVDASGEGCTDDCKDTENEAQISNNPSQKQCVCKEGYVLFEKKCVCLLDLTGTECVTKCGLYQFIYNRQCTCKDGLEPQDGECVLSVGSTWIKLEYVCKTENRVISMDSKSCLADCNDNEIKGGDNRCRCNDDSAVDEITETCVPKS